MKSKKNAFTLIELLAIIVILAIIAVITVPIILNIIENSRMGAATDSAYGYKDSVNKLYVSKLSETENRDLKLEGTYTITDGVLNGTGINEKVPVSGTEPTSGSLTYENGVFKNGCLVIGEYAVTFNEDGTTSTEKGICEELVQVPTIETCPGCVFAYLTVKTKVGGEFGSATPTIKNYTTNYTTLKDTVGNQRKSFLGFEIDETDAIKKYYLCAIKNEEPFCTRAGTSSIYNEWNEKYFDNCSESFNDYDYSTRGSCSDPQSGISASYTAEYDGDGTYTLGGCTVYVENDGTYASC